MGHDLRASLPDLVRSLPKAVPGAMLLVGGAMRDLLLGRRVRDWDLAAERAEDVAAEVARLARSRVVTMREEPPILRVPVRRLGTVDITRLDAAGAEEDLLRRDYTIDAVGLDLRTGEVLDPAGGRDDLRRALVRAFRETALLDDPTRIVRAYRLACTLGFRIDAATRELLRRDHEAVRLTAPQRVGTELLRLFESERAVGPIVAWMDADRVLDGLIPMWAALRGVTQGPYHHRDVLGHTVEVADFIDLLLESPPAFFPRAGEAIRDALRAPPRRAAVRTGALLHDIGKPPKRVVDEAGRIWFRGHDATGAELVDGLALWWGWPRLLRQAISGIVGGHIRVMHLSHEAADTGVATTDTALRRLLRDLGEAIPGIFLVCAADLLASRGPAASGPSRVGMRARLDEIAARCLELREEARHRPRLVTGDDLIEAFDLRPGRQIGRLLAAIESAREEGQVGTRDEALSLAGRLLAGKAGDGPEEK